MEGVKEAIKKISSKVLEQKSEFEGWQLICEICKERVRVRERLYYGNIETICSQQCYEKYIVIKRDKYYKQHIHIIPKKFQEIKHDNEELRKKLLNKSLFITGGIGVGKTVLMAAMVKIYIKNFLPVNWISYPGFIMFLQSSFRKNTENPFEIAEEVAKFEGWLAIDDIGAEKLTEFVRQITYYILNERA